MSYPYHQMGAMPVAEDAATVAAVNAAQPKPDRELTKELLWKKCPFTKDPHLYALASTQFSFPQPLTRERMRVAGEYDQLAVEPVVASRREAVNIWSERAVDRWLSGLRAQAEQLAIFLAK